MYINALKYSWEQKINKKGGRVTGRVHIFHLRLTQKVSMFFLIVICTNKTVCKTVTYMVKEFK